jgi:hypothetical protein
MVEMSK